MRIEEYQEKRARAAEKHAPKHRGFCNVCLRPHLTCYCRHIQSFDPKIRFVILIHVREAQRRIATGRISHLCLENSLLLKGYNYSNNARVNAILGNPAYQPVILYPGSASANLSTQTPAERKALFPAGKELVIFVIDGTWTTARKIVQRSTNLQSLPQICFSPTQPSRFRLRKQPKPNYCSTVEAIHHTIELMGDARGFDTASRTHDRLLYVFDQMVEQQIELARQYKPRFLRFGAKPS